jgi:ssDNA-binding Zn-finger/Zn-ribbon topoisomerase 1
MVEDNRCPKCGSETSIRKSIKGPNVGNPFYVCTRYPECKGRILIRKQEDIISLADRDIEWLIRF